METKRGERITVTVHKQSEHEKLGVAVVVRSGSLYINEITSTGLFAETPLEVNDLVVSINGFSFRNNPNAQTALSVVQSTPTVTFVVRKKIGMPLKTQ